jgi:hypothetical protein
MPLWKISQGKNSIISLFLWNIKKDGECPPVKSMLLYYLVPHSLTTTIIISKAEKNGTRNSDECWELYNRIWYATGIYKNIIDENRGPKYMEKLIKIINNKLIRWWFGQNGILASPYRTFFILLFWTFNYLLLINLDEYFTSNALKQFSVF